MITVGAAVGAFVVVVEASTKGEGASEFFTGDISRLPPAGAAVGVS